MKNIVVIGAGNIGSAIAWMLAATGDYRITVADRSADQLANVPAHERVDTEIVDIADRPALEALLKGKFAVLSAAPSLAKIEMPCPFAIMDSSVLRSTSNRWIVGVSHLPAARATIRS